MHKKTTLKLLAALAAANQLSGCASNTAAITKMNSACLNYTYQNILSISDPRCTGSLDIRYFFSNGINSSEPINLIENDRIKKNYIKQEQDNWCYAASLQSTFKYYGKETSQSDFSQNISNECHNPENSPLSLPQIIYAATASENFNGAWPINLKFNEKSIAFGIFNYKENTHNNSTAEPFFIYDDVTYCRSAENPSESWKTQNIWYNPINLIYKSLIAKIWPANIYWKGIAAIFSENPFDPPNIQDRHVKILSHLKSSNPWPIINTNKKSLPIIHTISTPGNLLQHFSRGAPIIAGIQSSNYGHTVLISGIYYKNSPTGEPYIEKVQVMDPSITTEDEIYEIEGNKFLSMASFMLAFYME